MTNGIRYMLAFGVPLLGAAAFTPIAARFARRAGVVDPPRPGRFHSRTTPYLGGLAIAGAVLLVSALVTGAHGQLLVVLLGALAIGTLGLVDDVRNVGPVVKVTVEASLGVALWIAGIRVGLFGIAGLDLLLTVMWVVVVTNAVNILDNMDGVAAGVAAISALGFAAIAAGQGEYLVASLALAAAAGCLGFLPYNFPPASIFLGDAGSLLLGFLLASLALKLDLIGSPGLARAIVPALALAVPLFDMALVMIARVAGGRPVYLGGTDHAAHRLHANGMKPWTIALIAYATQGTCSIAAFLLSRSTDGVAWASLGLTLLVAVVLLALFMRMQVAAIIDAPDVGVR